MSEPAERVEVPAHALFTLKIALHLAAEAALHLALPALARYTLPFTMLWLLWETWRHVRATMHPAAQRRAALPLAGPERQ